MVVGLILAPESARETAGTAELEQRIVPVAVSAFDDERQMAFAPVLGESVELMASDVGRVTATACIPGEVITSGSSPKTVDDRPLIALATSIPLWRDLHVGMRGYDVRALQEELVRLGRQVRVDGVFRTSTRAALAGVIGEASGLTASRALPSGVLAASRVVWLPAPEQVVVDCAHGVGDMTTGIVATTGSAVAGLRREGATTGAVPGARVVRFEGIEALVEDDGLVRDPQLIAALEGSWWAAGEPGPVQLTYVLADPLEVTTVPPAALFGLAGGEGCVVAEGQPRPVSVIASSLGRTMVSFNDGADPPSSVWLDPGALECA